MCQGVLVLTKYVSYLTSAALISINGVKIAQ